MKFRSFFAGALALALSASLSLAQTGTGSGPLTIAKGGTNAITAAAARINLGFAATANRLYGTDGSGVSTVITLPAAGLTLSASALAFANDLAALEGLSSTGIARRTGTDAWSLGTAVSNAELATMAAYTIKANATGSSAVPTDVSIPALTQKASPVAADKVMIADSAASDALKYATVSSLASAGSVGSFNGLTGAVSYNQYGLINHSLAVSASAGALTIALKDSSGADASATSPVYGNYRSPTGTTGSWVQRSVTAANSLVISSGSTMGVTSTTAFRIWVVLFDDAGTMRLGAINCSTSSQIFPLNQGAPASSLAEGGAGGADNAGTFYTGTAVTSKSFLIVGYIEWGPTGLTAGTWTTTNVNFLQSFGSGIRRPGDTVQSVSTSTTTTGSTTSATFVALTSGLTQAITPSSAANPIYVMASGGMSTSGSFSARTQLSRGTTAATNLFGSMGIDNVVSGAGVSTTILGFDFPNTTSSTTYAIQGKTTGGTLTFPTNPDTATIVVQEIMG